MCSLNSKTIQQHVSMQALYNSGYWGGCKCVFCLISAPDDYNLRRKRVRLTTGATMGKFTVETLPDNLIEDVESFTARYQGVSVGDKGCDSQTTVNIMDGTLADVDFNPVDYTVMEGGNVTLNIELSAVVAPGVRRQVDIRTENGTAHSKLYFHFNFKLKWELSFSPFRSWGLQWWYIHC